MESQQQVPAGWYPDPQVAGTVQFWDGTRWTGQRAQAQQQLVRRAPGWWRSLMLWGNVAGVVLWFVLVGVHAVVNGDQGVAGGGFVWTLVLAPIWGFGNLVMTVLYFVVRRYEQVPVQQ